MTDEKKIELIKAILGLETAVERIISRKEINRHKKHLFRKLCPICGESFKGNHGLAVHHFKRHRTA